MKLLGKNIIDDFKKKHSSSRKALDRWVKLIESAHFENTHEVKQLFGVNVDFVNDQVVFDVPPSTYHFKNPTQPCLKSR